MRILQNFCIGFIKAYRLTLAPLFMSLGVRCRFEPSCSEYALQAIRTHGVGRGVFLGSARLLRCHPLCRGGIDPVPGLVRKGMENG